MLFSSSPLDSLRCSPTYIFVTCVFGAAYLSRRFFFTIFFSYYFFQLVTFLKLPPLFQTPPPSHIPASLPCELNFYNHLGCWVLFIYLFIGWLMIVLPGSDSVKREAQLRCWWMRAATAADGSTWSNSCWLINFSLAATSNSWLQENLRSHCSHTCRSSLIRPGRLSDLAVSPLCLPDWKRTFILSIYFHSRIYQWVLKWKYWE